MARPVLALSIALLFAAGTTLASDPAPPGLADVDRFPTRGITASPSPRALPVEDADRFRLPRVITLNGVDVPFHEALEQSGTVAWIVLHHGVVVDEHYFGDQTADTLFPVFSVTKSIVGTLSAIARARGDAPGDAENAAPLLASALGERFGCRAVSWRQLLDMRTGIGFSEVYDDASSDVARLYLAADLDAEATPYQCSPGRAFRYASIDSQWLGVALEAATGQPLDRQLSERLWAPMGASADASWSTDSKGRIKAFCCLNARASDLARLGLLVAERGRWNDSQVLPEGWVDGLLTRAKDGDRYADQWWLLHDPEAKTSGTALLARGILGQFVFVHPDEGIVIVRIGEREGDIPWQPLFGAIVNANADKP